MSPISKIQFFGFTRFELPVMTAIEQLGIQQLKDLGDGEYDDVNPVDSYLSSYMEDLSIAGYSETRPNDRLSSRAFSRLLRIKPDELEKLKEGLEYDSREYRDFALCSLLLRVMSMSEELFGGLPFICPSEDAKPEGPFYPASGKFDLAEAVKAAAAKQQNSKPTRKTVQSYLEHMVKEHTKVGMHDGAVTKLAGMLRLDESQLQQLAKKVIKAGAESSTSLSLIMAYIVCDAIKATPRFVTGARWAQPEKKN